MIKKISIIVLISFLFIYSSQSLAFDKSKLVGYTLIDQKTIDGDFEGCDFGKIIKFMDGTYYICDTYSYTYSYMPEALIYAKKVNYKGRYYAVIKMVVEDEVFDMEPILLK